MMLGQTDLYATFHNVTVPNLPFRVGHPIERPDDFFKAAFVCVDKKGSFSFGPPSKWANTEGLHKHNVRRLALIIACVVNGVVKGVYTSNSFRIMPARYNEEGGKRKKAKKTPSAAATSIKRPSMVATIAKRPGEDEAVPRKHLHRPAPSNQTVPMPNGTAPGKYRDSPRVPENPFPSLSSLAPPTIDCLLRSASFHSMPHMMLPPPALGGYDVIVPPTAYPWAQFKVRYTDPPFSVGPSYMEPL